MSKSGNCLLVFPEGTDWGVVQLNPASGFAATWQYDLQNLQDELGTGFGVDYVIGPYKQLASVEIGTTYVGLIGLGVQLLAFQPERRSTRLPAAADQALADIGWHRAII